MLQHHDFAIRQYTIEVFSVWCLNEYSPHISLNSIHVNNHNVNNVGSHTVQYADAL